MVGEQPMVIGVAPSLGVNTLGELIALAKRKPGQILFAATTRNSIPHYTMELLLLEARASMTYVFYGGTAQALGDVVGGRLPVVVDGYASMAGAIANGAVGRSRSPRSNGCRTALTADCGGNAAQFHRDRLVSIAGASKDPGRHRAEGRPRPPHDPGAP